MEAVIVIVLVALAVIGAVLWWQTKRQGRFGLGKIGGTDCPRCGTRLPMIRKPSSTEEAMWGGWTCPNCGCKVDRYGKERAASGA
jgi:hypothetical protein